MPEHELIKVLEEEAEKERRAILDDAKKEADGIIEAAEKEKQECLTREIEELRGRIDKETTRYINAIKKEVRGELLGFKYSFIDRLFDEARDKLFALPSKRKQDIVISFLKDTLKMADDDRIEGDYTVYTDGEFVSLVKETLSAMGRRGVSAKEEKGLFGIVLSIDKGRVVYEETIDTRLERAKKELLPRLCNLLFEEKGA